MPAIPSQNRRILEARIDAILVKHGWASDGFVAWLVREAFPGANLVAIENVTAHKSRDYRASGDDLAWGETDVEIVATIDRPGGGRIRVALLIEDKVDAREMPQQGLRYRARGRHERNAGAWQEFACILLAPRSYLDAHYTLTNAGEAGWDCLLSFEDLANHVPDGADAAAFREATSAANAWNKPVPEAVKFWDDYRRYGRERHPAVPVFVETQQGSRVCGVWPSFYDNQLRNNRAEPRRRRVQIVHMDTADYVCLFLKKVAHAQFVDAVNPILEVGMYFAPPGGSWQSIRITTGAVDCLKPLAGQETTLDRVFEAARRFHEFYIRHESTLINVVHA